MPAVSATRVAIIDDHGIFRAGLRQALQAETDLSVTFDGPDATASIVPVDVLIVAEMAGRWAPIVIDARDRDGACMVILDASDEVTLARARDLGVASCVGRGASAGTVVRAVRHAANQIGTRRSSPRHALRTVDSPHEVPLEVGAQQDVADRSGQLRQVVDGLQTTPTIEGGREAKREVHADARPDHEPPSASDGTDVGLGQADRLDDAVTSVTEPEVEERSETIASDRVSLDDDAAHIQGSPLGPRDVEILASVAAGYSNRQVGDRLGLSDQTVKNRLTSILRKVGAVDRTEAVVTAIRRGWLPIGMIAPRDAQR